MFLCCNLLKQNFDSKCNRNHCRYLKEGKGKVINQKVVETIKGREKIEASFTKQGILKGMDLTNTGTFWTIPIENGAFYGEAKGTLTTTDGEIITYTAQGCHLVDK